MVFLFHTKMYTWSIRATKILRILALRPGFVSGFHFHYCFDFGDETGACDTVVFLVIDRPVGVTDQYSAKHIVKGWREQGNRFPAFGG